MIEVYTDGSCVNTIGGYAFVILKEKQLIYQYANWFPETTNNKMELQAIIASLHYIADTNLHPYPIQIFSDSEYCVNGITVWTKSWIKNGWKTADKKDVKNKEYWIELLDMAKQFNNLTFNWIYGHNGNYFNEMVDCMAKRATKTKTESIKSHVASNSE